MAHRYYEEGKGGSSRVRFFYAGKHSAYKLEAIDVHTMYAFQHDPADQERSSPTLVSPFFFPTHRQVYYVRTSSEYMLQGAEKKENKKIQIISPLRSGCLIRLMYIHRRCVQEAGLGLFIFIINIHFLFAWPGTSVLRSVVALSPLELFAEVSCASLSVVASGMAPGW